MKRIALAAVALLIGCGETDPEDAGSVVDGGDSDVGSADGSATDAGVTADASACANPIDICGAAGCTLDVALPMEEVSGVLTVDTSTTHLSFENCVQMPWRITFEDRVTGETFDKDVESGFGAYRLEMYPGLYDVFVQTSCFGLHGRKRVVEGLLIDGPETVDINLSLPTIRGISGMWGGEPIGINCTEGMGSRRVAWVLRMVDLQSAEVIDYVVDSWVLYHDLTEIPFYAGRYDVYFVVPDCRDWHSGYRERLRVDPILLTRDLDLTQDVDLDLTIPTVTTTITVDLTMPTSETTLGSGCVPTNEFWTVRFEPIGAGVLVEHNLDILPEAPWSHQLAVPPGTYDVSLSANCHKMGGRYAVDPAFVATEGAHLDVQLETKVLSGEIRVNGEVPPYPAWCGGPGTLSFLLYFEEIDTHFTTARFVGRTLREAAPFHYEAHLPSGRYDVWLESSSWMCADAPSTKTKVAEAVDLSDDRTLDIDWVLHPISGSVLVDGEATSVELHSGAVLGSSCALLMFSDGGRDAPTTTRGSAIPEEDGTYSTMLTPGDYRTWLDVQLCEVTPDGTIHHPPPRGIVPVGNLTVSTATTIDFNLELTPVRVALTFEGDPLGESSLQGCSKRTGFSVLSGTLSRQDVDEEARLRFTDSRSNDRFEVPVQGSPTPYEVGVPPGFYDIELSYTACSFSPDQFIGYKAIASCVEVK